MTMRYASHEHMTKKSNKKQNRAPLFPFIGACVSLMPTPFKAISNSKNVHFHFSMCVMMRSACVRVCFSEFA